MIHNGFYKVIQNEWDEGKRIAQLFL